MGTSGRSLTGLALGFFAVLMSAMAGAVHFAVRSNITFDPRGRPEFRLQNLDFGRGSVGNLLLCLVVFLAAGAAWGWLVRAWSLRIQPERKAPGSGLFALAYLFFPFWGAVTALDGSVHGKKMLDTCVALALLFPLIHLGLLLRGLWRNESHLSARNVFLLFAAIFLFTGLTARSHRPTGDEPTYLMMSQSLVTDFDLDIANQHREKQYRVFLPRVEQLALQGVIRRDEAGHPSCHSQLLPGTSLLTAPAFLAGPRSGPILVMALLGALTVALIFATAVRAKVESRSALLATLLIGAASPFVFYAGQIYPEMPAACLVALLAWLGLCATEKAGFRHGLLAGLAMGALLWLNVRFFPLAALLGIAWAVRFRSRFVPVVLPASASSLVLGGLLLLYFTFAFGSIHPGAGYGYQHDLLPSSAGKVLPALFGLPFDARKGLFPFFPGIVLVPLGFWWSWKRPHPGLPLLGLASLVFFGFLSLNLAPWDGGHAPASRFLICLYAVLGLGLAHGVERLRRRRLSRVPWVLFACGLLLVLMQLIFRDIQYDLAKHRIGEALGGVFDLFFPYLLDGRVGVSDGVKILLWIAVTAGVTVLLGSRTGGKEENEAGGNRFPPA
ncbi:MAG: hypothetical protein ACYTHN_17390 [Planctomycetota bacterium]